MRNFAVKFAILTRRFESDARAQDFLDLTPGESLEMFKDTLPLEALGALRFGFSDTAFLAMLDHEFDVDLDSCSGENGERGTLVFKKHLLDAESVRLAGLLDEDNIDFDEEEERLIQSLGGWLLDVTRPLYRDSLSEERVIDIQAEYEECYRIYARKFALSHHEGEREKLGTHFARLHAMTAFTHAMTAEAIFKADAAKAVFGEHSGYHLAWLRKQVFRHMISGSVKNYITSCAA